MKKTTVVLAPLIMTIGLVACGRPEAVPENRPTSTPPPPPSVPRMKPLPDTGFNVAWRRPSIPSTVAAGKRFAATVTVQNTSDQVWLAPQSSDATHDAAGAVRLGYRWLKPSELKAPNTGYADARGDLSQPLSPGGLAVMTVQVVAPALPGSYELQLDLCQELVTWFASKGAVPLLVPVRVK